MWSYKFSRLLLLLKEVRYLNPSEDYETFEASCYGSHLSSFFLRNITLGSATVESTASSVDVLISLLQAKNRTFSSVNEVKFNLISFFFFRSIFTRPFWRWNHLTSKTDEGCERWGSLSSWKSFISISDGVNIDLCEVSLDMRTNEWCRLRCL